MNSQDLRYLQEAYLEIVMDEGYKERPVEKMKKKAMKIVDDPNYKGEFETAWRHNHMFKHATNSARSREAAKRKSQKNLDKFYEKEDQYESFDIYDLILSHLLDEGYAETSEAAKVIMVNMSEEWREEIVEAYVPWDFGPKQKAKSKYTELLQRKKSEVSKGIPGGRGTATRANIIGRVGTEMRRTLDKDTKETGTDPQKQGLQPSTERHTKAAVRRASKGLPSSSTARKAYG